jgi:hypothetical protein
MCREKKKLHKRSDVATTSRVRCFHPITHLPERLCALQLMSRDLRRDKTSKLPERGMRSVRVGKARVRGVARRRRGIRSIPICFEQSRRVVTLRDGRSTLRPGPELPHAHLCTGIGRRTCLLPHTQLAFFEPIFPIPPQLLHPGTIPNDSRIVFPRR